MFKRDKSSGILREIDAMLRSDFRQDEDADCLRRRQSLSFSDKLHISFRLSDAPLFRHDNLHPSPQCYVGEASDGSSCLKTTFLMSCDGSLGFYPYTMSVISLSYGSSTPL